MKGLVYLFYIIELSSFLLLRDIDTQQVLVSLVGACEPPE